MNVTGGWEEGERQHEADLAERDEVLARTDLVALAEDIGVQVHADGLTCPNPEHQQSGNSSPVWLFSADDDVPRWWCRVCGTGGTAIDYVLIAGYAEDYRSALDLLDGLDLEAPVPAHRPRWPPEDPRRKGYVRGRLRERCEEWAIGRGWMPEHLRELLGPQVEWRCDDDGTPCLRVYSNPAQEWWTDRSLEGRWKHAAGHEADLLVWEPSYFVRKRGRSTYKMRTVTRTWESDETPSPLPRPLVVEGGSDFVTAVVAQHYLEVPQRFVVVGLPGVGCADLLADRDDWAVVLDNDDAGRRARERIAGRHLYVPESHNDLSDWFAAVDPPHHRQRWATSLVNDKEARP